MAVFYDYQVISAYKNRFQGAYPVYDSQKSYIFSLQHLLVIYISHFIQPKFSLTFLIGGMSVAELRVLPGQVLIDMNCPFLLVSSS